MRLTQSTALPSVPFDPLHQYVLKKGYGADLAVVCYQAGMHRSNFCKWKRTGNLPMHTADKVACSLGVHPSHIWHDWYERTDLDALGVKASTRECR